MGMIDFAEYDSRRPMYQACGLAHPTSPPTTTPPPPTTSVEQIIGGKTALYLMKDFTSATFTQV